MIETKSLKVKIFGDGADKGTILSLYADPLIAGFTTNPTLMRKAGVNDYETFAHGVLKTVTDKPISFEVFSDDFDEMEAQSKERQEEIQKVLKIAEEKKKERAASEKIKAELSEIKVEEVKTPEDKVEGFKVEEVKKVGRPKKIKAE